jgi:phytoene synthase
MLTLEQAYAECRRITKENAKNFYYAFIALPPDKRSAIYAVYSFCRFCDDAVDEPSLSMDEKLTRLADIRDSLQNTSSTDNTNPVFMALADTIAKHQIPLRCFEEVINGVEMDLTINRYNTFDDLRTYCYRVASAVGLICVEIYGYREPKVKEYAVDLGLAMQLTNIIRDVQEDLGQDRIYLPLDELDRFGYSEEDLKAGIVNEAFRNLMAFQAWRARRHFRSGLQLIPHLSLRSRTSPAVLAALYQRILDRIEATGFNVFDGRMSLSTREKYLLTATTWLKSTIPVRVPKIQS